MTDRPDMSNPRPTPSPRQGTLDQGASDAHLRVLLTMAHEADAFAQAAGRGDVSAPARAGWGRLVAVSAMIGTLAAAAAVAIIALPALLPAPQPGPGGASTTAIAGAHRSPTGVVVVPRESEIRSITDSVTSPVAHATHAASARDVAMPTSGDATVLLAVFGSEEGSSDAGCDCTVFSPVVWSDGRPLEEIGRGELVSAALARRCGGSGELRFVLAMQGPVESLPANAAAARSLASCVSSGPDACSDEGNCFASAALRCVPDGVNVLAETMQVAAR